MAKLILKNLTKIYPYDEKAAKKWFHKKTPVEIAAARNPHQVTDRGFVAVRDFNLEVEDQEFIVLIGPSGCGKSTTLRMIAGLEEVTEGQVCIGDRVVNDIMPKDRDISMVFQNFALYPYMTVYENIAFPLKMKHMSRDEIDRAVTQAAEILDLTDYLYRKPKALSGGQRQRVAIGRAIVRDPHVMLLDEPLSNLDAKLRNQMRAEIIKLRQRIHTTFVYVTHDQTEAMSLGDRIVVMNAGSIQQVGTPQEVFNHPRNLFVAEFIGSPRMNIFDAQLVRNNGRYAVVLGDLTVELSEEKQTKLSAANVLPRPVKLGVRPEHMILEPGIDGQVEIHELMGSSLHLHVRALEQDVMLVLSTMNMTYGQIAALNAGAPISFCFPGNVCHLFDAETGLNLENE